MTVIYFLGILNCESAFVPQLSSRTGNVAFPTFHLPLYPHVPFLNTCASACCAILTPAHETPYGYQEAVPRRHLTPPIPDARPLPLREDDTGPISLNISSPHTHSDSTSYQGTKTPSHKPPTPAHARCTRQPPCSSRPSPTSESPTPSSTRAATTPPSSRTSSVNVRSRPLPQFCVIDQSLGS